MGKTPWMGHALHEFARGVKEFTGPADNPRIVHYHSHTSLAATDDEVPWCSSFACCCLECGAELASPCSARARDWLGWGKATEARYGAIVVLRRGTSKTQGHVGFFLDWTPGPEGLFVLSGNQSNQVSLHVAPRTSVLGYRWPIEVETIPV